MMTTNDEEICHRCETRPGKERYYVPGPFSVSGSTMKLSLRRTIGCDECWEQFLEENKDKHFMEEKGTWDK